MKRDRIVGILLAAGRSTRFGADKLLQPLHDGTPMALRSARTLIAAVPRTLAVVRADQDRLSQMLRGEGLEIVVCAKADEGIGASLACGVAAAEAAGWVIALADMPFIAPATIECVAAAVTDGAPIAAPLFQGRRGHPVGFGREFLPQLRAAAGDRGARVVLEAESARIIFLPCDDPGVLRDVDMPADLASPDVATQRGSL